MVLCYSSYHLHLQQQQLRSHLWAAIRIWIISLKEAAAWEALFVYDSLLFAMIIIKGYKNKRSMERMPLLQMILRDGVCEASGLTTAKIKIFSFSALYKRRSINLFRRHVVLFSYGNPGHQ
ncbi:hypothetical protein D9758_015662 [Tetrapyrgos nigripes]|uniref:Uncharacterized protein n=1 Tax=Tetrapyrgos nigripes TaxID=182062 RepID=A0A8H5FH81_9AGAR|nr:hypothetical protein D9758_015662 [Tetrapyrgos nigripes]